MTKKEMIKNGEDVSLDNGEVVVLNGVSVAEKQKETEKTGENEVPVNEETQVNQQNITSEDAPKEGVTVEEANVPKVDEPSVQMPVSSETPQISTAPIDLTGIITPEGETTANDDTIYPQIPSDSFVNSFNNDAQPATAIDSSLDNNFSNPMVDSVAPSYNEVNNPSLYGATTPDYNPLFGRETEGFAVANDKRVFKVPSDVDSSIDKFMGDVRRSYNENIANPTKTLVEFVNAFVKWGNQVTAKGLNRELFDEYDKLMEKLNDTMSYESSNDYGSDPLSSYDDYKSSGGRGMAA